MLILSICRASSLEDKPKKQRKDIRARRDCTQKRVDGFVVHREEMVTAYGHSLVDHENRGRKTWHSRYRDVKDCKDGARLKVVDSRGTELCLSSPPKQRSSYP
jgi:hypothetical protein